MKSVLQIAQAVTDVVGMQQLATLVGNQSPHARAMRTLLNWGGQSLARERNAWGGTWSVLTREWVFNTVPGQEEYALPIGFVSPIDGSIWDRSQYREARGTLSPQEWQERKSGLIASLAITTNFRFRRDTRGTGRSIWLDPVPEDTKTLVIEYTSDQWVISQNNQNSYSEIQDDTDQVLFDPDLIEIDLTWRIKQSRGLSFGAELAEFELKRDRRMADDAGPADIRIGRSSEFDRIEYLVPDTGYGNA